jgi:AraC family ethanolamine operon transcriptional activator
MREVTVAACADSGPFRTAAVQEQVFDGLLTRLLAVADPALPRPRHARTALARRRAIVRTIDDYVAGNPDASPTLQELCRIAHASERTLQYAFRYCYDVSPTHYVKLIRLHRVRRALLASEPGAGAVTAVANRFGFWHMGHFGQAYRQVFQESPSSTLRVQ